MIQSAPQPPILGEPILKVPQNWGIQGATPTALSLSQCHSTIDFVIQFLNAPENKKFINFFEYVWGSDEIIFQTIVFNSSYATQCRFYGRDFKDSSKVMLNENNVYLHYIDWDCNREDPAILIRGYFQSIQESDALFARKFDEVKSGKLLEKIDYCLLKI